MKRKQLELTCSTKTEEQFSIFYLHSDHFQNCLQKSKTKQYEIFQNNYDNSLQIWTLLSMTFWNDSFSINIFNLFLLIKLEYHVIIRVFKNCNWLRDNRLLENHWYAFCLQKLYLGQKLFFQLLLLHISWP